ncbi:MAG: 50S ribosomal protein L16 [Candidatus Woesearchaeota archaeon]
MAKLRKGRSYTRLERPYTRISKYKAKAFVKASPAVKVVKADMGNSKKSYEYVLELQSSKGLQIRQEAIEAARQSCNRYLEKTVGKQNFFLKLRIHPHHVLRENPLAKGAGADRFSTGMAHAFGKAVGRAARVKQDQTVFSCYTNKEYVKNCKLGLKRAGYKLPCACKIQLNENK